MSIGVFGKLLLSLLDLSLEFLLEVVDRHRHGSGDPAGVTGQGVHGSGCGSDSDDP